MSYKVNEIFYSLQGEGIRAGKPSIFVRFSGCDLTCGFCDTEFESGSGMGKSQIVAECLKYPCREVVLTGGEPALQIDHALIEEFHKSGFMVCVETNGNNKIKAGVDFITCSPKVAEHVVAKNFPNGVDELKYVRHAGQSIPSPQVKAKHYFISPVFNGDLPDADNLKYCINLVKENPTWQLTWQQHKLWKVR